MEKDEESTVFKLPTIIWQFCVKASIQYEKRFFLSNHIHVRKGDFQCRFMNINVRYAGKFLKNWFSFQEMRRKLSVRNAATNKSGG